MKGRREKQPQKEQNRKGRKTGCVCVRERDFSRESYQRVRRETEEERKEEEEKRGKRNAVMTVYQGERKRFVPEYRMRAPRY